MLKDITLLSCVITVFINSIIDMVSCTKSELVILKDTKFRAQEVYFGGMSNSDSLFYVSRRYYVSGYSGNESQFDSSAVNLICEVFSDSIKVKRIVFDFRDMGLLSSSNYRVEKIPDEFSKDLMVYQRDYKEQDSVKVSRYTEGNEMAAKYYINCEVL